MHLFPFVDRRELAGTGLGPRPRSGASIIAGRSRSWLKSIGPENEGGFRSCPSCDQGLGRQSDFLRLYQAVYVRLRLQGSGCAMSMFTSPEWRRARLIGSTSSSAFATVSRRMRTIFLPSRDFVVSLEKLIESAMAVVTVSDFAVRLLQERFP